MYDNRARAAKAACATCENCNHLDLPVGVAKTTFFIMVCLFNLRRVIFTVIPPGCSSREIYLHNDIICYEESGQRQRTIVAKVILLFLTNSNFFTCCLLLKCSVYHKRTWI